MLSESPPYVVRGARGPRSRPTPGSARAQRRERWPAACPKPLLQPALAEYGKSSTWELGFSVPETTRLWAVALSSARKLTGCDSTLGIPDKHGGEHEQSGS